MIVVSPSFPRKLFRNERGVLHINPTFVLVPITILVKVVKYSNVDPAITSVALAIA